MRWNRAEYRESSPAVGPSRATQTRLLVALIVVFGAASLLLGQDANWDLQNYHYYNPWAWWHGRAFTWDVAPAQIQTFHNPMLDLPFFALVSAGLAPPVIALVLTLPAALAAWLLCKLALLLFAELPRGQRMVTVTAAVIVGVTSAMGLGAIGNTMNEWPLTALLTWALWLLVRDIVRTGGGTLPVRTLLAAGAIAGVAFGAKLTAGVFVLAIGIALIGRNAFETGAVRLRMVEAGWFALAAGAGMAVSFGPWSYRLWEHFANPVFPYANQWLRSPWWEPTAVPQPHDYGPHTLMQWWAFPFTLARPPLFVTAEVPYTDGRMAVVWALAHVAAVAWLLRHVRQRHSAAAIAWRGHSRGAGASPGSTGVHTAWRFIGIFAVTAFLIWTASFAIYRYLLIVDLLLGLMLAVLLRTLLPPRAATVALVVVAVALLATTRIADWGRVEFGVRWFSVDSPFPRVAPDALVVITTGAPVSYLIPLLPPTSRYVALLNTAVNPERPTRLTREAEAIVREHRGPVYQLTHPLTEGSQLLAAYGLARTRNCAVVVTNMPTRPLELCRLVRVSKAPVAG